MKLVIFREENVPCYDDPMTLYYLVDFGDKKPTILSSMKEDINAIINNELRESEEYGDLGWDEIVAEAIKRCLTMKKYEGVDLREIGEIHTLEVY